MGPRTGLEVGWDPEPVCSLGGTQSRSGGWVGPTDGLEAGWDTAGLEAGWDLEPVWRLSGSQSQSKSF